MRDVLLIVGLLALLLLLMDELREYLNEPPAGETALVDLKDRVQRAESATLSGKYAALKMRSDVTRGELLSFQRDLSRAESRKERFNDLLARFDSDDQGRVLAEVYDRVGADPLYWGYSDRLYISRHLSRKAAAATDSLAEGTLILLVGYSSSIFLWSIKPLLFFLLFYFGCKKLWSRISIK